jgi:hypothetical protein
LKRRKEFDQPVGVESSMIRRLTLVRHVEIIDNFWRLPDA